MSGKIRFISDPHFGHRNMAIARKFRDEFHMEEYIIDRWNSVVNKRDTTWVLGDITMEKNNYEYLNRLNGFKRVILGNHDKGNHVSSMIKYVNSVHGMAKLRSREFGNIWLTHCPVHPQEFEHRINYNIHGHIHEGYCIKDKRYINVCMEVQDYTPKSLEELIHGH